MPRYNIAPTQDVPIVRLTRDGAPRLADHRTRQYLAADTSRRSSRRAPAPTARHLDTARR